MESSWKEKAGKYYRDGLKISDIAVLLEVSRQSVSAYLKTMPDYGEIKDSRRRAAAPSVEPVSRTTTWSASSMESIQRSTNFSSFLQIA